MASERRYLFHGRIGPYVDLILTVAVCGDQFVDILCKHQIADLASSLDRFDIF